MKKTDEEIKKLQFGLIDMKNKMLGDWRHYKGGIYSVVGFALDSETCEPVVFYRNRNEMYFWTRPLSQWEETVEYEGKTVPRFLKVLK